MADPNEKLTNGSGASTLGVLEAMARRMDEYDKNSDFEKSYHNMQKEFEQYTET